MSVFHVKGLLDRASRQSLGMRGIVVERLPGCLCIEGIVRLSGKQIDGAEFKQLLQSGDAQQVDGPSVNDDSRTYAALWVGDVFAETTARLKVQLPPLPKSAVNTREGGVYWIGPTQHIWRVLDSWLVRAFRRSIREDNAELAALMTWALPDRPETRAAIWHTNQGQRKANLDWWTRLDRDHGGPKVTPSDLEETYAKLAKDALSPTPRWFGFCGKAAAGDTEIAKELSQRLQVPRIGFGQWLKKKAQQEGDQTTRRVLQRKGQQMIDRHGALEFCLEVLGDYFRRDVSLPNVRCVIDGIRHKDVLLSLESLLGEDRFIFVSIERPDEVRRQLLAKEEHIDDPDAVMNDPTELEIPGLQTRAAKKYQREERDIKEIAEELAIAA